MNLLPFSMPDPDTVDTLSVSSTSSGLKLTVEVGDQVMFINGGSTACFVVTGAAGVEATTSCVLIHGNSTRVFTVSPTHDHVAAITASGTTTLYIVRGNGV